MESGGAFSSLKYAPAHGAQRFRRHRSLKFIMQQTRRNSSGLPPPLGPEQTVTNQITLGRLPRKGAISLGLGE